MKKIDVTGKLFDLNLFGRGRYELLKILENSGNLSEYPIVIFTPNPEQVVLAQQSQQFAHYLSQADILIPDGVGLLLASRILSWRGKSSPLKERITGLEVVEEIFSQAHKQQWRVLIIGGKDYSQMRDNPYQVTDVSPSFFSEVATEAQKAERIPAGIYWTSAYDDIHNPSSNEEEFVTRVVSMLRPHVVLVAMGAPFQEQWVIEHRELLEKNGVQIAMVVGGACDVLFGKLGRAPTWLSRAGLEWLYRLWQEPWRWRRQMKLLTFIKLVAKEFLTV